jgi:hypothetical protein
LSDSVLHASSGFPARIPRRNEEYKKHAITLGGRVDRIFAGEPLDVRSTLRTDRTPGAFQVYAGSNSATLVRHRLVLPPPLRLRHDGRVLSEGRRAALVLLLALAWLTVAPAAHATGWIVEAGREQSIKALFGAVWGGKAGPFRLTGARIRQSDVVVSFVAAGRTAVLRIEHPDDVEPSSDAGSAFTLVARDKGIAVTGTCDPACTEAEAGPLRTTAEEVIGRFQGGLFVRAGAPAAPGADGSATPGPPRAARPGWYGRRFNAWRVSAVLLVISVALAAVALVRRLRARRPFGPHLLSDMGLVFAGTIAAAVLLTEASLSNWYLDFLPANGDGSGFGDQLGSGELVIETVARAILPWTDGGLFGLTLAAGAAGVALAYAAFRSLEVPRATCLAAMLLLAVTPLSARVLWSGSPHALALPLEYLLLVVWLRVQREGGPAEILLALVLIPTIALLRVDAILFAATPLVWGLGRERLRRRLALAAIYAAVLAGTAWMTWELVVRPAGAPVPNAAERWRSAHELLVDLGLFRQFFDGAAGWFPAPVAYLLVPGAAVLLVRRPGLLAKILVTLALPQIALARFIDGEGLIGCRYFLPALPLLALLAAAPLGPLALPRGFASRPGVRLASAIAAAAAALATIAAAWPRYRYRYTYQEEYRFLRAALADAPRPGRVFHVAVHDDPAFRNDPDCCLSPGRSPLLLALPGVAFEPLEVDPGARPIPDADEAGAYYYESAICSWGPTESTERRDPGVAAMVHARCARLAQDARLVLVASETVPARAAWPFFASADVRLRLFRLTPPPPPAEPPPPR